MMLIPKMKVANFVTRSLFIKALVCIVLSIFVVNSADAATYYVDPDGAWGNDGTSWATAWNHPNRTNYTPFTYGDTVFIAPGEYDSVRILPPRGGTSIRTVYACSSEAIRTPILHSGNVVSGNWGDFATGVDSIHLNPTTLEWVTTDNNLVLYQRISGTKDSLMICVNSTGAVNANGEYYYDRPNDKLYVQPYGGGAASSYTFRYATKPIYQSSYEDQDNILLYGLDFRGGYQTVIMLNDGTAGAGDSVEIRNCNIGFSMVYSASNPSAIGCAAVYENNYSSWMRYLKVVGCTLHSVANTQEGAGGLHAGWGMLLYTVRNALIDSCVFINMPSSIGLKMGNVEHYGINADSIHIRNSFLYGGSGTNLWVGNYVEGVEVTGCVIGNNNATQPLKNLAFFTSSSSSAQDFMGGAVITNNTFVGGTEAIVQLRPHNSNGGNIFKYNIIYDPTGETSVGDIDISDDDYGTENPSSETYWDIDSNQYWFGANTFDFRAQQAASALNGQTSWAQWQAGGFDTHSVNDVDPGLTVTTGVTTDAVAMHSQTYAGKTWTVYGAIQPDVAITDTCIQITGKTTLPTADTCYCIVDSLLYTFAQRDTLIHTNGMDNIRIWGYHTDGGRGIIGYSISDTGSNSWVTDSAKGSVAIHVSGSDNVLIKNLAIVPRTIDDSVRSFVAVNALTVVGINLDNDSIVAGGFSSRAYQQSTTGGNRSFNQLLQNSYFGTVSKGYHRRDQLYGATIRLTTSVLQSDRYGGTYQYAYKARNNRIHTIHTGIGSAGLTVDTSPTPDDTIYPLIFIDSNTVTVDARNDLYMTYDDNDVNNSAGDPYGIAVDGVDKASRIMGNTISSMASTYYGGDGMLLQHIDATIDSPFVVAYNTMALQHGAHPRIAEGRQAVVGTYIRNYSAGYYVSGLYYHHNTGYLVVDEDTGTTYAGIYGECVRAGFENGARGSRIENNHFTLIPRDSLTRTGAGALEVSGLTFEQHDSTNSAGDANTGNNIARYNYWRVPRNPIWLGGTRIGIGADNVQIVGDTCNTLYDGDSTFVRFHQSGTYYSHSKNNTLQDMVLQGYANVSDVIKGTVTASADEYGKQLHYLRSITVNLKDSSGTNVNGGTMWALNAYGHRFDMPNSNASGNSSDTLQWRFFGYDALPADGYVVADSNAFNNFTFWGKAGSDSISTTATLNWTTSQLINLQLTGIFPLPSPMNILRGINLKGVIIK